MFWHEYIPVPFYLRGRCNITMLLSRHRDAEWLSHAARYMGFGTVRGSSSRGGVASLKKLLQVGKEMNLTMTPDGPRGPRRVLAPGCIYLASRLQIPLVCLGFGYKSCWRLESLDRFAIPKPFTQARMMIGRRIHIPKDLDRDESCTISNWFRIVWNRNYVPNIGPEPEPLLKVVSPVAGTRSYRRAA